MTELVSVIVSVYNVNAYLAKCVKSIQNQTYQNLEIILVDDGSTDGSSAICDELYLGDSRIIVIHKENEGVVSARRVGLEAARGEYAIIIDGDDWIDPNMIFDMHKLAIDNCADIVTSGYYREYDDVSARVVDGIKEGIYIEETDKDYMYSNLIFARSTEQFGILPNLWNKLIKKDLLRELHLKIKNNIYCGEDVAILYSCCVRAKKIVITHNIYYHYVMRSNSVMHSNNINYFSNVNELYIFLKNEFENSGFKVTLFHQLDILMVKMIFLGMGSLMGLSDDVVIPCYDFDKSVIEKDAKIILYGAGNIGQAYYKQICADRLYKLEGWVDRNYLYYQEQNMEVSAVEAIEHLEYDYIVLAFKYEDMAEKVKKDLVDKYAIKMEKLIWLKPISIIDKYWIRK